eukprot:21314-Heterococcus_DN1.PRE.2
MYELVLWCCVSPTVVAKDERPGRFSSGHHRFFLYPRSSHEVIIQWQCIGITSRTLEYYTLTAVSMACQFTPITASSAIKRHYHGEGHARHKQDMQLM